MIEDNMKKQVITDTEERGKSLMFRQGNTTFIIDLYFNGKTKETLEEKIRKLIRKEVESENF